jgi:hypothetical protein
MLPPLRLTVRLKATGNHRNLAFVARFVAGRPAKRTNGSAPAGMTGTRSTQEASAPHAFTSGLKLSAFLAADGRPIRIGMRSNEAAGAMDSKKAVIR